MSESEEQLRQLALEYATRLGPDYDHHEVLAAARNYLAFMKDQEANKDPE